MVIDGASALSHVSLQLSYSYGAGAQFQFSQVFEARIQRRLNLGR
jgi:hypothetical protein